MFVSLSVHMPDCVSEGCGGVQMLGEAFKAEVAANGGKMPPLGVKTLMRLAGRLWVKRKIFHGKQKLGGLFGIQVSVQLLIHEDRQP